MSEITPEHIVKIRPRAIYKKNMNANGLSILPNARKTFTAREDAWGELVTGHTKEEWDAYKVISKSHDYIAYFKSYSVALTDTEIILNISKEQDLIKYRFLKSQYPQIVAKAEDVTSSTQYIMYNEEEVAEVKNKSRENLVKAMGMLGTMTESQKAAFLRLYGFKTDSMTPAKIMDELCNQIEKGKKGEGAEEFIMKFDSKDKNDRILLKSLIQHEILRPQGMSIYYGTDVIAASEDLAVEYLKDPKNTEMKSNFIQMLKAKQGK